MSHVSGGAAYTIQRVPAPSQLSALNIKQSFYGREKQLLKGTGLETGLVSYCPSTILLPHDYPVLPRRRVHRPRRSQRHPSLPLPQYNHTFAEVSRHPQTRVGDLRIQIAGCGVDCRHELSLGHAHAKREQLAEMKSPRKTEVAPTELHHSSSDRSRRSRGAHIGGPSLT